jgi:hypothetical protein
MAKRSKKGAKARRGTSGEGKDPSPDFGEVGRLNSAGNAEIDTKKLEGLKKKLGVAASKVKFVARNAPFKRRYPVPPT